MKCVSYRRATLNPKEVLTPSDFQGQRFISLSLTDSYRQLIDSTFAEHHVERKWSWKRIRHHPFALWHQKGLEFLLLTR